MRPWPKTVGTARASNEVVVKCIFIIEPNRYGEEKTRGDVQKILF